MVLSFHIVQYVDGNSIIFNASQIDSIFWIDSTNGNLYLNNTNIFYSTITAVLLTIEVKDNGYPSLSSL